MFKQIGAIGLVLLAMMFVVPAHAADGKPVIAVGEISSSFRDVNGDSFRSMLETAISKAGKFELVERSRLNDLLKEQGMSESGLLDGNMSVGGVSGVDYLLYGTITELKVTNSNALIMSICNGTLGIDARIVDVVSGSIRMSERVVVEEQLRTASADQNACSGVDAGAFREIERQAADTLAAKMAYTLFPIKVIKVSDSTVYLNYGAPTLEKGSYLKLVSMGESFVDPDTGEELGSEEEDAGLIQVTEAKGKYSIARVLSAVVPLEIGFVASRISSKEGKAMAKNLRKRR